ncbi:MAG: hypothetical protein WCK05_13345 [Planctomycetota bacterium]
MKSPVSELLNILGVDVDNKKVRKKKEKKKPPGWNPGAFWGRDGERELLGGGKDVTG